MRPATPRQQRTILLVGLKITDHGSRVRGETEAIIWVSVARDLRPGNGPL
jgi:hypothetical protein